MIARRDEGEAPGVTQNRESVLWSESNGDDVTEPEQP